MRAALEVNELVNGRSEECEPEDSVKEVDIDFTMQENHYILDLPPHLPELWRHSFRAHGGAHRYETFCRPRKGGADRRSEPSNTASGLVKA
jgi:hypothetical protein